MRKSRTGGLPARKLSLAVAAAALVVGAAAALSTGAPIYTGWSAPVSLGPTVNSPTAAELGPALSSDGLSLYFYSNRGGNFDIWVARRPTVNDPWGAPANLGPTINTPSTEIVPAFSADGLCMYFASDRPGGFGPLPPAAPTTDIYRSCRADVHDDFGWQAPTNLGPNVNTAASESGSGYFENGGAPQLIFGSNKPGGPGLADLYLTNLQADGSWGPATAIAELNSTANDNRPTVRSDGLEIFFYSGRTAGSVGLNDLWTSTRPSLDAPWSAPVNLGAGVNSTVADQHPYLSADATTLVFSSDRNGGADLYLTTRAQILPTTKDECKKGGWERFGIYRNQGDCVSDVATKGKNQPG